MRYISSAEIRSNPAILWKEDEEKETVITVNGKPKVLSIVIAGDPEEMLSLIRRVRAEKAIENMWERSRQEGNDKLTLEEINQEIIAARKELKNE